MIPQLANVCRVPSDLDVTGSELYLRQQYESFLLDVVEHYASERPEARRATLTRFEEIVASSIGFGGDQIQAYSTLFASQAAIRQLSTGLVCDPLDWLGELNNQVIGRLKNHLSGIGIETRMGTPLTISAESIEFGSGRVTPMVWQIDWSQGSMGGILAVEIAQAIDVDHETTIDVASEGSMHLF